MKFQSTAYSLYPEPFNCPTCALSRLPYSGPSVFLMVTDQEQETLPSSGAYTYTATGCEVEDLLGRVRPISGLVEGLRMAFAQFQIRDLQQRLQIETILGGPECSTVPLLVCCGLESVSFITARDASEGQEMFKQCF